VDAVGGCNCDCGCGCDDDYVVAAVVAAAVYCDVDYYDIVYDYFLSHYYHQLSSFHYPH
jgi:hypothetical protein